MGDAMEPLKSVEVFQTYLATLGGKPFQGIFIGTGLTMLIQSSAAIIGIIQGLFSSHLLDLQGSIPILLGSNIGTCITAVLAAIGATASAKRVAAAHVLFNVIGTIIFMVFLVPYTSLIDWLEFHLTLTPEMTIAFAHGLFNIANTILLFPFIGALALCVEKIIPGQDKTPKYHTIFLDPLLITQAPSIALGNAKKELIQLASYAIQAFEASYYYINHKDIRYAKKIATFEATVDNIDEALTSYLVNISNESLSPRENELLAGVLDATRDLERIGDHADALGQLIHNMIKKKVGFSDIDQEEMEMMYQLTHQIVLDAIKAIVDEDVSLANDIIIRHKKVKHLERKLRKTHISRLNNGQCSAQAGISFIDIMSHYTRITDHALNLAEKVTLSQI